METLMHPSSITFKCREARRKSLCINLHRAAATNIINFSFLRWSEQSLPILLAGRPKSCDPICSFLRQNINNFPEYSPAICSINSNWWLGSQSRLADVADKMRDSRSGIQMKVDACQLRGCDLLLLETSDLVHFALNSCYSSREQFMFNFLNQCCKSWRTERPNRTNVTNAGVIGANQMRCSQ